MADTVETMGARVSVPRDRWWLGLVIILWLMTVGAAIAQWVVFGAAGSESLLINQMEPTDVAGTFVSVGFATFGALVIVRGESARYGWLMLGFGCLSAVVTAAGFYSLYAWEFGAAAAVPAQWVQDLFPFALILGPLLLPALFPDGTAASPLWRRATIIVASLFTLYGTYFVFADRHAENLMLTIPEAARPWNPTGVVPASELTLGPPWLLLMLSVLAVALGSLITRWRTSGLETRLQIKWVVAAFCVLFAVNFVDLIQEVLIEAGLDLGVDGLLNALSATAQVGVVVAFGLAVLKYRLYAVDLVINRTVVYGILSVIVVVIYVVIVIGLGAAVPVEEPVLAIAATGLAAVVFAPLRDRVQTGVNRMMFGRQSDPYTLLSHLGDLMTEAGTPDETLQTVTKTVIEALRVPRAVIELEQDGTFVERAASGGTAVDRSEAYELPLRHLGEIVGRLVVWRRSRYEPLSPRDLALLDDIAGPAGAIARSARFTIGLQASRERLVLAREEERRRIRRDLHDRLGPSLAFQTLQLDAIIDRIGNDPHEASVMALGLKQQNQQLVSDIRRLVHELRPPALDELGVVGALTSHINQLNEADAPALDIESIPDPLPSLSAAVEVAAYHIVREAITNVIRHAAASQCTATLQADTERLEIAIRDDGLGIADDVRTGVGMQSMRERSEELGGTFEVRNLTPHGTEIVVTMPITENIPTVLQVTEAGNRG